MVSGVWTSVLTSSGREAWLLNSLSHVTEFGYCKRSNNIISYSRIVKISLFLNRKTSKCVCFNDLSFRMTVRKTFAQKELWKKKQKKQVTTILLFLLLYYELCRSGMYEGGTVFSKVSMFPWLFGRHLFV